MAPTDWSLLPSDLVRRVADCFIAANDVDYYMDLRAVCGNWRRATDDPKENPTDPRYRPNRRWIIIDDTPSCYVLVNADTGRFLRRDVPPLGGREVIRDVPPTGGFLVLAQGDTNCPRALTIVNPFTGYAVHFRAPTPPTYFVDVLSITGSPPTLMLYDQDLNLCVAGPDECFTMYVPDKDSDYHYWIRLAALSGIYDGDLQAAAPLPKAFASEISRLDFEDKCPGMQNYRLFGTRFFLVECDGKMLLIYKNNYERLDLFEMDTARDVIQPIKSIGNHAIFLGNVTSVAVNAEKFPYIEANNIYFQFYGDFYRYDLNQGRFEMIQEDCEPHTDDVRPLSIQFFDLLRDYSTKNRAQSAASYKP